MSQLHLDVGHAGRILTSATAGPLSLREVTYTRGAAEARHEHPFGSVILMLAGRLRAHGARGTQVLHGPGSLRLVPPDEPHGNRYETSVRTFVIGIETAALHRAGAALDRGGIRVFGERDLPAIIASRMFHEFAARDVAWELAAEGLRWEMLVAIARAAPRRTERDAPRWLREVREQVQASFRERLRIGTLARGAGVHPVHLGRTFRRHYGCSLATYVRELRLEAARHALAARDEQPIARIATRYGFADQSQLTRAFRERYGTTPARYRAAVRPRTHGGPSSPTVASRSA